MAFMAVMMICAVAAHAADYLAGYNNTTKTLTLFDSKVYNGSFDQTCRVLESDYHTEGYNRNGLGLSDEIRQSVKKVVFHQSFKSAQFNDISAWFINMFALESIEGLENFDMSKAAYALFLFKGCWALQTLDLSSKDMSNLEDAENMFMGCSNLKSLKMPKTSNKLKNIQYLFNNCEALQSLDTSMMVTSGVEDMSGCFFQCSSMRILNLSNFDTSSVTTMAGMFLACENLIKLYIYNFNTRNVTTMTSMFNNCSKLTDIVVGDGWTIENVQDWGDRDRMFWECKSLVGGAGTTYYGADKKYAHIDGGPSNPGYLRRLIYYDLWLGGVQVDELNQDGIPLGSGYAQYNPNNKLLFLNDATIDASNAGIKNGSNSSNGIDGLTIQIKGNCTIKSNANPMILYGNTTIEDWRDTENKLVMEGSNSINVYKTLTFKNKKTRATISNGSLFSGPTTSSALVFDDGVTFGGYCNGSVINYMSSITLGSGLEYVYLYDDYPISFNSSEHTLYMGGSPLKSFLMIGEYYPLWIAGYHMSSAWELTPLLSDLMPVQISSEDVYSMKKLTLTGTIPSYSNNSALRCTAPFLDIIVTDAFCFVTEEEGIPAFDYQGRGQCTITGTGTLVINSKNGPAVKADDGSSLEIKDVDFSVQGKTGGFKDVKTLSFTNAEGTATCESGYVVSNVNNFFISRCYINNNVSFDSKNKRIASNVLEIAREKNISTDIDQVTSNKYQVTSDDWYTIDGRKLSGKPNAKGIYIHNGKKSVLKNRYYVIP